MENAQGCQLLRCSYLAAWDYKFKRPTGIFPTALLVPSACLHGTAAAAELVREVIEEELQAIHNELGSSQK